jgi:transcriptional regulator with XRE-family HTH domain
MSDENQATANKLRRAPTDTLVGEQLREWREAAGLSQEAVAEQIFGWGRDAMSKIESAKNSVYLHDYLLLCQFFREQAPYGHPGVLLADLLLPRSPHSLRARAGRNE